MASYQTASNKLHTQISDRTFATKPIAQIARETGITPYKLRKERAERGITGPDGRGGNRKPLDGKEGGVKCSILLTTGQLVAVKKAAKNRGITFSRCIREAVEEWLAKKRG